MIFYYLNISVKVNFEENYDTKRGITFTKNIPY